jgi:hypothetical protein
MSCMGDINHIYIRDKMGVATTRRPRAVRCNIACRRIQTRYIYSDSGKEERDFMLSSLAHVTLVAIAVVPLHPPIYPVEHQQYQDLCC